MKHFLFLVALATALVFSSCQDEKVVKDLCELMDDETFKEYCLNNFDTNGDGKLSQAEADDVYGINVEGLDVFSLKGIEHFTNIEFINAANCEFLLEIVIPETITSIGSGAFSNCLSLESITIPDSVTSIGDYAFGYCGGLTSVTIPDSVTDMGVGVFCGCYGLESVTIPNSITSIKNDTFSSCLSLTSITIPDSITSIGDYAFGYCESLTSVTIPDSVTSLSSHAFDGCSKKLTIDWNICAAMDDEIFKKYCLDNFDYCKDGKITQDEADVVNSINISGLDIVSLKGIEYFTNLNDLYADNCDKLLEVVIPNSVTSIRDMAFYSCNSLKSVTIPSSVRKIGRNAFYGCSSLTSIVIPEGVTSIGDIAFDSCDSLKDVTIPNSICEIGKFAFSGTGELTVNWNIPNISYYTSSPFYMSRFTSLIIGDDVTSIGCNAFSDCNFESVIIGKNVKKINSWAFFRCGLKTVYCKATTPPEAGECIFSNYWYDPDFKIYVPRKSVAAYKTTNGWEKYTIEPYDF